MPGSQGAAYAMSLLLLGLEELLEEMYFNVFRRAPCYGAIYHLATMVGFSPLMTSYFTKRTPFHVEVTPSVLFIAYKIK